MQKGSVTKAVLKILPAALRGWSAREKQLTFQEGLTFGRKIQEKLTFLGEIRVLKINRGGITVGLQLITPPLNRGN